MATQLATTDTVHPVVAFRQFIDKRSDEFKMALPSHISVDKFRRVATTAVQNSPILLDGNRVERQSLFNALIRAAQDGLLPDGREGAIVPYKGKAQWMPMVAGIMAKVRRSGEIADWFVSAVHEKDEFEVLRGDDNCIRHRPFLDGDPGKVTGAYSIVTFKDGTKSRDYMARWRIEKARQCGNAKDSLQWTTFYDEGAIKTVIKHHAKRLPQSTDIEAAFERDFAIGSGDVDEPQIDDRRIEAEPVSRLDALEHQIDGKPTDAHGEQTTLVDALDALTRADTREDVDAIVNGHADLSDEDADKLRSAAMERIGEIEA